MRRFDYLEDCIRIQAVCLSHGYYGTLAECEEIWEEYSGSLAAGWMFLPEEDDGLWLMVEEYVLDNINKSNPNHIGDLL